MCLETGLNCRHKDFQSFALPTELSKLKKRFFSKISPRISNKLKDVQVVALVSFKLLEYVAFGLKNPNNLNLS